MVFNRWGNVVFEQLNYRNDWDGDNLQDEPLPNGTYFVILDLHHGGDSSDADDRPCRATWTSAADEHRTHHAHLRTCPSSIAALSLALRWACSAQQEVMVSQYMFNGLFLNPAYAGTHALRERQPAAPRRNGRQVTGAPQTSMLAYDAPLMGNKMGVGLQHGA